MNIELGNDFEVPEVKTEIPEHQIEANVDSEKNTQNEKIKFDDSFKIDKNKKENNLYIKKHTKEEEEENKENNNNIYYYNEKSIQEIEIYNEYENNYFLAEFNDPPIKILGKNNERVLETIHLQDLREIPIYYCKDKQENKDSFCYCGAPKECYCKSKDLMIDLTKFHLTERHDGKKYPLISYSVDDGAYDILHCSELNDVQNEVQNKKSTSLDFSHVEIFKSMKNGPRIDSSICNDNWNSSLTYLLTRNDFVNVYHSTYSFFAFWATGQVFQLDSLRDIQVVFMDTHEPGFLDSIWTTFTGLQPIRLIDLKHEEIQSLCVHDSFFSCPENSVVGINFIRSGRSSAMQLGESELWIEFRNFLRRQFSM